VPVLDAGAGHCARPGNCDLASGLCGAHSLGTATAQVGDPCTDDTDCAGNMRCMMEIDQSQYRKASSMYCTQDDECCSGRCDFGACTVGLCTVDNRNGYCTIPGCYFSSTLTLRACPSGSTCNTLYAGGLCQKTCNLSTSGECRGYSGDLYGDYECRAWNNISIGGVAVTASPVCEPGTSLGCEFFDGTTLDCSDVGGVSNPTAMDCRDLSGFVLSDSFSPTGYCFDTTASGTQHRSPLPQP
jgi:hypothetical protein